MKNTFFALAFVFFAVAAVATTPKTKQLISGFGGGGVQPIQINSEELTIDQKAKQALFSGKATARQGKLSITALRMSVHYGQGADGRFSPKFLYASGDVLLTGKAKAGNPPPIAQAHLAEYNMETKKLILIGDVVLKQDRQTLKGQSLTIDLVSGLSRLDSVQAGKTGRIRGVFRKD